MAYQVLARKWRPQDFSSVVGQEPIVTALRNALTDSRIAQAYLFSGIRGIGKTSVARVLAKALNCEHGPAADPCNECTTCGEITAGADIDVIEIDAATYSKVEQVRELSESLKYGPARDRYKVVIIDEIHRLSRQAFDALLKIVEEPPSHLVFVFATTEAGAVPATILSRCQEFRFRRVAPAGVTGHLEKIAAAEGITVSDTALRLIARAGEGSIRDAVALLDQMATYGSGTIPDQEAARILGGLEAAVHQRLLTAILEGDATAIREIVGQLETEGWDPRYVYADFLGYCRDALHLALGSPVEQIDLPRDDAESLTRIAQDAGYENLLRLTHQLLGSEAVVRRSESGPLATEIAWLRAAELPKLTRLEELLGGGQESGAGDRGAPPRSPGGGEQTSDPRKDHSATPSLWDEPDSGRNEMGSRAGGDSAARSSPTPENPASAAPSPPTSAHEVGRVATFLEEVSRLKQSLAAHLADAERLEFADGELQIFTPPADPWLETALSRNTNKDVLDRCLEAVWGGGSTWRLMVQAPAADPSPPTKDPDPLLEHPAVQSALGIFGGTARTVGRKDA